MVGVAQLVRAPDCGSGGRGFETRHSPQPFRHHLLWDQRVPFAKDLHISPKGQAGVRRRRLKPPAEQASPTDPPLSYSIPEPNAHSSLW